MFQAMHQRLSLDTEIKNLENIRENSDFFIDYGGTWPSPKLLADSRNFEVARASINQVADGSIYYVRSDYVNRFFDEIFSLLSARIVLVTGGEDNSNPGMHSDKLNDCKIIKWFGQNCDLLNRHPKFVPMPIGMTDPHIPCGNQEKMLYFHRTLPGIKDKPLKVYATFHLNLSHAERIEALQKLKEQPFIHFEPTRKAPEVIWEQHKNFSFTLSPRGNGLDCHRTWEALILHTIPIAKRSTLDQLYEGFPVVLVNSWEEVTPENLMHWKQQFVPWFKRGLYHKITKEYWVNEIKKARNEVGYEIWDMGKTLAEP